MRAQHEHEPRFPAGRYPMSRREGLNKRLTYARARSEVSYLLRIMAPFHAHMEMPSYPRPEM